MILADYSFYGFEFKSIISGIQLYNKKNNQNQKHCVNKRPSK